MGNNITHNFTENKEDYKFIVELGGLKGDLICYEFYKKRNILFGLTYYWTKLNVRVKNEYSIWDAKDTIGWDKERYIRHGMVIWNDRISNGVEEFLKLTK